MPVTTAQIRGWLIVVFHSPLLGFWLLQVVFALVGLIRGFSHPGQLLAAAGTVGVLARLTRLVAKHKGISSWPPSLRAFDASPEAFPRRAIDRKP